MFSAGLWRSIAHDERSQYSFVFDLLRAYVFQQNSIVSLSFLSRLVLANGVRAAVLMQKVDFGSSLSSVDTLLAADLAFEANEFWTVDAQVFRSVFIPRTRWIS